MFFDATRGLIIRDLGKSMLRSVFSVVLPLLSCRLPYWNRECGCRHVEHIKLGQFERSVLVGKVGHFAWEEWRYLNHRKASLNDAQLPCCGSAQVDDSMFDIGTAVCNTHVNSPVISRIPHFQDCPERVFQVRTCHAVLVVDFSACSPSAVKFVGIVRGVACDYLPLGRDRMPICKEQ